MVHVMPLPSDVSSFFATLPPLFFLGFSSIFAFIFFLLLSRFFCHALFRLFLHLPLSEISRHAAAAD